MDKNILINITFSFLIIVLIIFYFYGITTDIYDQIASVVLIGVAVIILLSKNNSILDIAHFLYCAVCIPYIAIFSKNKHLLILNILMLVVIIFTRYYYKKCILNEKQNDEGFCTDLSHNLGLDWYLIFPVLLVTNVIRYYKIETT